MDMIKKSIAHCAEALASPGKRKLLSLVLAALMVMPLAACGSPDAVEVTLAPTIAPSPTPALESGEDATLSSDDLIPTRNQAILPQDYDSIEQQDSELRTQPDAANEQITELTAIEESAKAGLEQEQSTSAETEQAPEEMNEPVRSVSGRQGDTETDPSTSSDPSTSDGTTVWIPKSGSKYHSSPSCSNMKDPTQVSLSTAIAEGYTACKKCH